LKFRNFPLDVVFNRVKTPLFARIVVDGFLMSLGLPVVTPPQFMKGIRRMLEVKRFFAFGLAVITSMSSLVLAAQSGDLAVIQERLNSQIKLTTVTADRSDIVTAGDVIELERPGLIMYAVASPMPPSNSYKNGKIGQGWGGFGKDLMIGMAAPGAATAADYPHRPFGVGEKCWVTGIQVQKDGVLFQLYSDPYDDIRYYANLKVPFPNKKETPSADVAMKSVAEVLMVAPQDNQAGPGGPTDPTQTAASPSQDPAASAQGTYFRKDKTSDTMELGPNGVFAHVQNGRKYEGNYAVQGDVLTIWGPRIPGRQKCSLVGNVIIDPGKTIWEKPAVPQNVAATPAASPAAAQATSLPPPPQRQYEDVAPPPPPPAPAPTISMGQTKDEVTAAFGDPQRKAAAGPKEIFFYTDLKMKITFTNGKVSSID
jgi:hypothetical protein